MRLTCPNCGAQYEVPDEVIPFDGRDVQCSNCGDTWFQGHPDNPATVTETEPEPVTEPISEPAAVSSGPGTDEVHQTPEVESDPAPETEEAAAETAVETAAEITEETTEPADIASEMPQQPAPQPDIDSGITDILRQEAEREANLRSAESGPIESQPDLGLDAVGDAPNQQSGQARSRMARLRGETPGREAEAGSRRELLPDIEEINSAWSNPDEAATGSTEVGLAEAQVQNQRGGFVRGFAMIVIVGVLMALLYSNAAKISGMLPAAEPVLNSYVAMVDQARIWLDARLGDLVPDP